MKNKIGAFVALLALAFAARAGVIVYNSTLVSSSALAYNNVYPIDMQAAGVTALSAQAVYSSATIPSVSIGDGAQAAGSLTVVDYTALSSASAVNHITVASNSGLSGAVIAVPGYTLREGVNWAVGASAAATAQNIKTALATVPYLSVSAAGSVVYATATAGASFNSYGMTSNNAGLTVLSPTFTGGRDNATATVNGVVLLQGRDWTAATSNAATAASITSAVNASPSLAAKLSAVTAGSASNLTSRLNGAALNYAVASSSPAALAAVSMSGGVTPAMTLGSSVINKTAHGLSLALPVQYSGTPAIGGLVSGSTYYAVPVGADSFALSKYSTSAIAGIDLAVVTSTNTQLSQNLYAVAPLAISGTPGFKWQVSNNNADWSDLLVSSVTMNSYTNPPSSTIWAFGYIGTRYIRLNVAAPTTGAISLAVTAVGSN